MTAEAALLILNMAMSLASEKSMNVSVAVFDQNCHLTSFAKMPGSYIGSINSAQEKGRSACFFRKNTKDFEDAVQNGRVGIIKATDVVPIAGGLIFYKNKIFSGSIGVSGSKSIEDHELALKILKSLKYDLF